MKVWIKKITACVMVAVMLLMAMPVIAVSAEESADGFTYFCDTTGGTAKITGYSGDATDVVIPAELGGYPVTVIANGVFQENTQITRVTVPNSVTHIESSVFRGCTALQTVVLPAGLTTISDQLFEDCTALSSVALPDGITSIGSSAFRNCAALTSIDLPEGLTSINYGAFYNCTRLSALDLPKSLTYIAGSAFSGCEAISSLVIPEGITQLNARVFDGCKALQSLTLPKSLLWFEEDVFYGCYALSEIHLADLAAWCRVDFTGDTIPFSRTHDLYIGDELVTDLVIPEGITRLNRYAFTYCGSITSVTVPDSVVSMGGAVFWGCENLAEIHWPDTLLEIDSCGALIDTAYYKNEDNWTDNVLYLDNYLIRGNSALSGEYTVREGTTVIAGYAFEPSYRVTGISLPDSVISVGENAFNATAYYKDNANWIDNCLYIDHCLIQAKYTYAGHYTPPSGITVYAAGAFLNCSNLSAVTFPETIKGIYKSTFENCTALTEVTIPASVAIVHYAAFLGTNLNTLSVADGNTVYKGQDNCLIHIANKTLVVGTNQSRIPDDGSVTAIGTGAFYGRSGPATLFFSNYITHVAPRALESCRGVKNIYIGFESLPASWCRNWKDYCYATLHWGYTLGSEGIELTLSTDGTYYIVTGMGTCTETDLVLPALRDGIFVKEVGEGAFENNTAITSVTFPPELVTVNTRAFAGCTGITELTLPAKVTKLSSSAFRDCTGLKRVNLANCTNLKTLGVAVFQDCTALSEIAFPSWLSTLDAYALKGCSSLKSLQLPGNVSKIGNCALADLDNLESIALGTEGGNSVLRCVDNCLIEIATKTLVAGCKNSVIPTDGSVTAIGPCAFYEISTLLSVAIPIQIQSIGEYAFYDCDSLESVVVLSNSLTKVGYYAFASCESLKTAEIYRNVANVGQGIFSGCTAMTDIYCESGSRLSSWSDQWAQNCPATIHWSYPLASRGLEYTLSEDGTYYIVTGMGTCIDAAPRVPAEYNGLPVKEIGESAFENKAITGIFLPEGLEVIGAQAFQACNDLQGINIPSTVKTVGDMAFYSCDSLTRFGAGESLEHIGVEAFAACNKLETVVLPPTVKTIGADAFGITKYRCGVKSVFITDLEAWCRIDFGDADANPLSRGAALYVNEEWLTELTIPTSVTVIKPYTFYGLAGVKSVTLHDGVTRVGTGAFGACSMATLTLNDGLTRIDNYAFSSCDYLLNVTIPQSVAYMGHEVFAYCVALTDVHCGAASLPSDWADDWCWADTGDYGYNGRETTVHWAPWAAYYKLSEDGTYYILQRADVRASTDFEVPAEYNGLPVKEIAAGAFRNAQGLTGVSIPNTVESIGREAFLGCGNLTTVTLGTGVQLIDVDAFQDCEALESVHITDLAAFCRINVPGYDASPLYWADMLYLNGEPVTELVIPDGVESLACNFTGYKGLTGLVIPESVQEIGTSAFHSCVNLVTVEFPDTPVTVKEFAFTGCTSLKEVTLKNGVVQTGAFKNCTALERVYIHEEVTDLWHYVFEGSKAVAEIYCEVSSCPEDWAANWLYDCPAKVYWGWGKPQGTLGDVDGDSSITSTDARMTLQFYAGKIDENMLNTAMADVDGDGQITSTDARLILQKYAGKIDKFPVA